MCVSYSFEVLLVTPRCDYAVCAQVCMRVSSCLWGVDSHVCMRASSFAHVCVFLYVIVFLHRRASNSPFILSKLKLQLFAAMNVYTSLCEAARVYTYGRRPRGTVDSSFSCLTCVQRHVWRSCTWPSHVVSQKGATCVYRIHLKCFWSHRDATML